MMIAASQILEMENPIEAIRVERRKINEIQGKWQKRRIMIYVATFIMLLICLIASSRGFDLYTFLFT